MIDELYSSQFDYARKPIREQISSRESAETALPQNSVLNGTLEARLNHYLQENSYSVSILSLEEKGIRQVLNGLQNGNSKSIDDALKNLKIPSLDVLSLANVLSDVLKGSGIRVHSFSDQVTGKAGAIEFEIGGASAKYFTSKESPSFNWSSILPPPPEFGANWMNKELQNRIERLR